MRVPKNSLEIEGIVESGSRIVKNQHEEIYRLRRALEAKGKEMADIKAMVEETLKEAADLKFRLKDWHDSAEAAWKSPCEDEQHCSCVPLLRHALSEVEAKFARFKQDCGATYYPCPKCGSGMDASGCLRCENADLAARVEEMTSTLIHLSNEAIGSGELVRIYAGNTNAHWLVQRAEEARALLNIPTPGASERLREKHYRECEEIAKGIQDGFYGDGKDDAGLGAWVVAKALARAMEEGT